MKYIDQSGRVRETQRISVSPEEWLKKQFGLSDEEWHARHEEESDDGQTQAD